MASIVLFDHPGLGKPTQPFPSPRAAGLSGVGEGNHRRSGIFTHRRDELPLGGARFRFGRVGLGRVVLSKRERVVMLQPRGSGLLGTTLRYPYEVGDEEIYFGDIAEV